MAPSGPLVGIRIVEFAGLGPVPFAGMLLAEAGADVIRICGPSTSEDLAQGAYKGLERNRPSLTADLKSEQGRALALNICEAADALIEGYRPGTMERMGLGPETLQPRNPSLVYGRVTGYGQTGPLANKAGHDVNYLAVSGVLAAMAREGERPLFPMNLVGNFGAGGMMAAYAVVCAVLAARRTGTGQVIDVAMSDGAAKLATFIYSAINAGQWNLRAGTNILDSGAPFYEVYETADNRFIAVGAIEPHFYAELIAVLGLSPEEAPQWRRERWPELKSRFAEVFATRTRDEWCALAATGDACITPVLDLLEAPGYEHNRVRRTFQRMGEDVLPGDAPRFNYPSSRPPISTRNVDLLLQEWRRAAERSH